MHYDITINHESQTSICSDHHAWFSSVSFRSISANLTLIQKHKETHLVMTDIQYGEKMQRTSAWSHLFSSFSWDSRDAT